MKFDEEHANRIFQRLKEAQVVLDSVKVELLAYRDLLATELERVEKVLRGQWKPEYAIEEKDA
jgi:hypothetical protein